MEDEAIIVVSPEPPHEAIAALNQFVALAQELLIRGEGLAVNIESQRAFFVSAASVGASDIAAASATATKKIQETRDLAVAYIGNVLPRQRPSDDPTRSSADFSPSVADSVRTRGPR